MLMAFAHHYTDGFQTCNHRNGLSDLAVCGGYDAGQFFMGCLVKQHII
jgi:hypothetical protein